MQELRQAVAAVAAQARSVHINAERIPAYAASLRPASLAASATALRGPETERVTWYWLTLNAINFGSGWFPTLRKAAGVSGYSTVSGALNRHFEAHGPWSAHELTHLNPAVVAAVMDQASGHELMVRFSESLNDVGRQLETGYDGNPLGLIKAAQGSAPALVELVADWPSFTDVSRYAGTRVPFYKRAQILAADLSRSGAARLTDTEQLTMFADNLVPHVLRLDGILDFAPELVQRIDAGTLIEHGSAEEVEIRACAVQAVELIVAAAHARCSGAGPPARVSAAQIDELLWQRGQGSSYKASPRHRSRSTAY